MRILLTGGSGQVGTAFRNLPVDMEVLSPPRSEFDLAQPQTLRRWLDREAPAVILSVGAYTAVDRAETEPQLAFAVNRDAVQVLSNYAAEAAIPLIHLSTDYVFDGRGAAPYTESDIPAPASVYGASKLGGEDAARRAARHLVLRVSWVFSSHGSNFVRTMLRLAREREVLRVVDDQVGGPTWAGHIAQALHALVQRHAQGEPLPWGTWHYAGTPALSWCAFARQIVDQAQACGLIERKPRIEAISTAEYPTPARRPANSRLDCSRTVQQLGLPICDWREGLRQTLEELARGG